jgi:acetolactate synthase I/II/III large subunit
VRALAELTGIPVVTTLMARGAFPDSHPQHLGMPGMHGTVAAVGALQKSDLIISLGARFDDRVTGKLDSFAPTPRSSTPTSTRPRSARTGTPTCRSSATPRGHRRAGRGVRPSTAPGAARLRRLVGHLGACASATRWATTSPDGTLAPQHVIERLGAIAGPDAIYTAGVGQHQMWASQFIGYEHPGTWLNSGGLGTMGYAVPAAMGAKVGRPDTTVWAIDGDGCFQMTNQELATCAIEGIPIKVASSTTQPSAWSGSGRRSSTPSATPTPTCTRPTRVPDFVKLARPTAAYGLRCDSPETSTRPSRRRWRSRRPGGVDFRGPQGRHGLADGPGRHQQRRHQSPVAWPHFDDRE